MCLQVLVEAQVNGDGEGAGSSVSIMLQNAETVTLLGPQSQDMVSTAGPPDVDDKVWKVLECDGCAARIINHI